jgi:hypothetical protein
MNSRERTLILLLGVVGLMAVAGAAYLLVLSPIEEARADADRLETELSEKQARLNKLRKDKPKMEAAKKRSLPADPDTARVEYQAMLRKLLTQAGAPAGFTITPKDTIDVRTTPLLDTKSKKPAYSRVGFEVKMEKADVGTLVKFLEGYYKLNLLHQITRLQIVRKDETGGKGKATDRNDLTVELLTEGIILDGAENRLTLLSVPIGFGAVGGSAGHQALLHSREAGRNLTPVQYEPVLAMAGPPREYTALPARNIIHGSIPVIKPPPPPKKEEVVVVQPPPKEDISPFIKMTGLKRATDGSGGAVIDIWDKANNHSYTVTLVPKGEKFETKVRKTYVLGGKDKLIDLTTDLEIVEAGTSTNRKFSVVGWSGEELILTEKVTAADAIPDKGNGKPSSKEKKPQLPPAPPGAMLIGGPLAATAPVGEKVFAWRVGQTLKSLTELPPSEARDAIKRAFPNPGGGTSNASTVSTKVSGD